MEYSEIPLQKISDEYGAEFSVNYFHRGTAPQRLKNYPAHRDDNFLFIIANEGYGSFEVDFHKVERAGRGFFHVCPGQIHSNIQVDDSGFWCVLISPHLISKAIAESLYEYPKHYDHAPITDAQFAMIDATLKMLVDIHTIPDENRMNIRNSLINTFLNISVQIIQLRSKLNSSSDINKTRKQAIAQNFYKAVCSNIPRIKTVKEYAEMLNVSSIYLNEVVRSQTGRTPSDIISDGIILETKRRLIFTSLSIKEIAFMLGFDESYLSRMFKKRTGISPMSFRAQYLK